MRVLLYVVLPLTLFACAPAGRVPTQEILGAPVPKQPPARIPGGGIQIDVVNRTAEPQRLRVREPGGNWYVLAFPPSGELNLRCEVCASHFEATLTDDAQEPVLLTPGTEYEILGGDGQGHLLLRPRGGTGPQQR